MTAANPKSSLLSEVLASNDGYVAAFGDKVSLALPPARAAAFLVRATTQIFSDVTL